MLGCSGGAQRGRGCLHIHCSRGGPPLIGWWQCVDCSDNNVGWAQSHENESNQTLNCKTLTTNETNVQIVSQHDQGVDPGEEEVVWIRGKLQATRQTQKNTISLLILVQQSTLALHYRLGQTVTRSVHGDNQAPKMLISFALLRHDTQISIKIKVFNFLMSDNLLLGL